MRCWCCMFRSRLRLRVPGTKKLSVMFTAKYLKVEELELAARISSERDFAHRRFLLCVAAPSLQFHHDYLHTLHDSFDKIALYDS